MPEIRVRLKPVGFGSLDQRVQIGTGLQALDRGIEQPVLAPNHEGADCILRTVVVDFQPTVIQVADQLLCQQVVQVRSPLQMHVNDTRGIPQKKRRRKKVSQQRPSGIQRRLERNFRADEPILYTLSELALVEPVFWQTQIRSSMPLFGIAQFFLIR